MYAGQTTSSVVVNARRRRSVLVGTARRSDAKVSSATAATPPKRTIAPNTCRKSGKSHSSGLRNASTSRGSGLEDHQDEDAEAGESGRDVVGERARVARGRPQLRARHVALTRETLREQDRPLVATAADGADDDRRDEQGECAEDPAVTDLVLIDVDDEPDPEHEQQRRPDPEADRGRPRQAEQQRDLTRPLA